MKLIQHLFVFFVSILFLFTTKTYSQTDRRAIEGAGILNASVIKMDITPQTPQILLGYAPRLSTGINDKLYHRIIALDDGNTEFFLVSSDICLVSPSEYDRVAEMLQKQLGIKRVNFWWSSTHTHSAPEVGVPGLPKVMAPSISDRYKHKVDTVYTPFLENQLIAGIIEARKKLSPAKLGVGWGYSEANINRRAWDTDGIHRGGMGPDRPVDRKIGLIRLDKPDGSPLALISNYSMHATVLGPENSLVSGDVAGIVSEYVEEKIGAPMLYINGAAGNLAPIYSVYPDPKSGHLGQFKVLLGDRIIEANKKISASTDSVKLFTGSIIVETPRKETMGWSDDLGTYTKKNKAGGNNVLLPVGFLKINEDIAIWSAPLELFCEISMNIRKQSPFPYTFYYGYTNGWLGYAATEQEWPHKGYEVETVSPYTISIERDLTENVLNYLRKEMRNNATGLKSTNKTKFKKK